MYRLQNVLNETTGWGPLELKSSVPAAARKSTRHNSQGKAVTLRNYHVAVAINLAATTGDCWLLKLFVEAYGEGHIRLCFQNFQKDATRGCWSRPALDTCKEAFVALHSSGTWIVAFFNATQTVRTYSCDMYLIQNQKATQEQCSCKVVIERE